jgi:hypothetical protein
MHIWILNKVCFVSFLILTDFVDIIVGAHNTASREFIMNAITEKKIAPAKIIRYPFSSGLFLLNYRLIVHSWIVCCALFLCSHVEINLFDEFGE